MSGQNNNLSNNDNLKKERRLIMKPSDQKNKEQFDSDNIPKSNNVENQNTGHNVKKEVLGPNTKR